MTYLVYPDEGDGFARPENLLSFFATAEYFLTNHLGGRAHPVDDDYEDSSIRIPAGGSHLKVVKKNICDPHPERCKESKSKPPKQGEE